MACKAYSALVNCYSVVHGRNAGQTEIRTRFKWRNASLANDQNLCQDLSLSTRCDGVLLWEVRVWREKDGRERC
jgi:hypothetical protein